MIPSRRRVFVASPYAGDIARNVAYAKRCLRDSLDRGESPLAPHLLHPGVLDDAVPEEREAGLSAGKAWLRVSMLCAVYTDFGISEGMKGEVDYAAMLGIQIEMRTIEPPTPPERPLLAPSAIPG